MEIDIITFTDEQYATLTETQLQEVYKAQEKKDKLLSELETQIKVSNATTFITI